MEQPHPQKATPCLSFAYQNFLIQYDQFMRERRRKVVIDRRKSTEQRQKENSVMIFDSDRHVVLGCFRGFTFLAEACSCHSLLRRFPEAERRLALTSRPSSKRLMKDSKTATARQSLPPGTQLSQQLRVSEGAQHPRAYIGA